jgi:putative N6-adenine-specific DNA methylase
MSSHPFFIACARNLEPMLLQELKELGITGARATHLGVDAELTREEVYRVVYGSRIASRVLRPLAEFDCPNDDALYENARELNWAAIVRPGQTFKVSASVADSTITHSQFAALRLKDAVVDVIREERGERPDVDKDDPDVRLNLFVHRDKAVISLYYSTGVMHKRGYRANAVEAPLKENLAAAMLRLAKWDAEKKEPLRDFFCGSGTILLEAAMLATRTPGGWFRAQQGFEALPDFHAETWQKVKAEFDAKIIPLAPGLIGGADIDSQAVLSARANFKRTPWASAVSIGLADFRKLEGDYTGSVIVTNPPYGVRVGADGETPDAKSVAAIHKLYEDFGYFLKMRCPGARVCMLFPDPKFEKDIWFKPVRGMFIDNGAISVRANVYDVKKLEEKAVNPKEEAAVKEIQAAPEDEQS